MDSNSFIQLASLNFPENYQFRLRKAENDIQIFCPLRKKWFVNTPEEWVRQHCIQYIHTQLHYPISSLVAEYPVTINGLNQRADIIVLSNARPSILVECKRPSVPLNQVILDQALRYGQVLKTDHLFLTNGLQHLFAKIELSESNVVWLDKLPLYNHGI